MKPLVFVGREEGQFKKQREKREKMERGGKWVETRVEEYLEIVRGWELDSESDKGSSRVLDDPWISGWGNWTRKQKYSFVITQS